MIIHGDILEWAASYKGPKFHALLCDPPYHLTADNRGVYRLDGVGATRKGNVRGGFMGKKWDGGDIAFDPATWAALGEHMHPGAFGMAFASSRGWHRLACAIEDAGFVIHPSIFVWGFGSGFPKATNIAVQIDKQMGLIGHRGKAFRTAGAGDRVDIQTANGQAGMAYTAPATPLAQTWAGHRYGLQAIKPACEPVIVFQKPYAGKPVECIVRTGAGALWVDGGRIGIDPVADASQLRTITRNQRISNDGWGMSTIAGDNPQVVQPSGRWPANFALIHSPECNGECAPECAVRRLGEQSGDTSQGHWTHKRNIGGNGIYGGGGYADNDEGRKLADTGTAARYFFQAQWDQLDAADPVRYQAKASRRERDAGLDGLPKKPLLWSSGTQSPGSFQSEGTEKAARNPHPTVKPIALIEHLATLLLPPAEYAPRRIMIPFAGSGSEMIGATLAGWDDVVGIEREAEYVEIAEKRLAYWREQREEKVKEAESQMSLLEAVG